MQGDPFGVSFSPAGNQGAGGQPQGGQRPTPIQQAIQTLSLRIPRNAGAGAFTSQTLLDSPGGGAVGGAPNDALLLEQIKRLLFGNQPPGQMGKPSPMPRDNSQPGGTMPGPTPGGFQPSAQVGGPSSFAPPPAAPPPPPAPWTPGPASAPAFTPHFAPIDVTPEQPVPYDDGAMGHNLDQPPAPYAGGTTFDPTTGRGLAWRG